MTIKKRLSISNILMLISPIIITSILLTCLYSIYTGITGIESIGEYNYENLFFKVINNVDTLAEKWMGNNDFESIKDDIDKFNKKYNRDKISLAIYKENDLIYPRNAFIRSVPDILLQNGKYTVTDEDVSLYRRNAGDYIIIIMYENLNLSSKNTAGMRMYIGIFGFLALIFGIIFISRALTRFVFRGIVPPIETIVNGVHEIRDGNLSYRIQYKNNDEFAAVCSDFNEMAERLSDMVNARQKDETNRRELIAGISHDLRTPLTSIKAYLEGIEKGVASTPETQKRYFDTIKNKTIDLEYIINQLFLFSKLDIGDFPFHLEEIDIGQELKMFTSSHKKEYSEKGLLISLRENVDNVYVEIDVVQFRNVIYNIIENSLKYKDDKNALIKILCRENNGNIEIILTDNGPGVSEEALAKMFDVFYRSDTSRNNPSKGSGLGLAISKKIIERLKGNIQAKNANGGGLEIKIILPVSRYGDYENEKSTDY